MVESEGILNRKTAVDQLQGVMVIARSKFAAWSNVGERSQNNWMLKARIHGLGRGVGGTVINNAAALWPSFATMLPMIFEKLSDVSS